VKTGCAADRASRGVRALGSGFNQAGVAQFVGCAQRARLPWDFGGGSGGLQFEVHLAPDCGCDVDQRVREKRDTGPRRRSFIRGWVRPQR